LHYPDLLNTKKMCDLFQNMMGFARFVMAAICLCLCIGPILIILGAVFLASHNSRSDDIKSYNDAVNNYNSIDAPVLAQATMGIDGLSMSRQFPAVPVEGNLADVKPANHYIFSTSGVDRQTSDRYVVNVQTAFASAQSVSYSIPFTATVDKGLVCDAARCTDSCGDDSYSCDESRMRSFCASSFGGTYTDRSGTCYNGDTCGTCHYTGNLAHACVVMAVTSDGKVSASNIRSCYYPFTEFDYLPQSQSAIIEVMSERDPFIALQRITGGSDDFGITAQQQRNAGIAMLIVGIIITVIMIGIAVFFIRRQQRQREEQRLAQGMPPTVISQGPYPGAATYDYSKQQTSPPYGAQEYPPYRGGPPMGEPQYGQPTYSQPYSNPPPQGPGYAPGPGYAQGPAPVYDSQPPPAHGYAQKPL
jgi:hypothetical protein